MNGLRTGVIRVLVSDEHEIFRRGVVACLSEDPGIEVVDTPPERGSERPVNVAVVSVTAAARLRGDYAVVVCATPPIADTGDKRIFALLPRSGLTPDQLIAAVRGAAAGLRVSSEDLQLPHLDDRRLGILRLLADGADTREISQQLRYSQSTIKGLISSIETELDSRNRTQAVAMAIRRGLI